MTKKERLDIIKKQVQSPINIDAYNNDTSSTSPINTSDSVNTTGNTNTTVNN